MASTLPTSPEYLRLARIGLPFLSSPGGWELDQSGGVFVDFPETLRAGREYAIDFHYSGTPVETGRFGGIAFRKDPEGNHWINTACEGEGSSIWWPS